MRMLATGSKWLKGKFYRMAIRPVMLYGAECWPTKRQHIEQMSVAEMHMLRWIVDIQQRTELGTREYVTRHL